ncbi:MAG: hypothetical protein IT280_13265 [Ignavibacteria bacterium]|nr:hypothetical protein [Ignavibacteria bacterium]
MKHKNNKLNKVSPVQMRNTVSHKCIKCGHKTDVIDVKPYKSFKANKDIKNPENNTYIHRWRKCRFCGSLAQTAEIWIEGTFIENNYEDFQMNLEYYREHNNAIKK